MGNPRLHLAPRTMVHKVRRVINRVTSIHQPRKGGVLVLE
jgi:hypothetical protein